MAWIGKFIGALVGFWATRSLWGALVGAFIGHLFDQGAASIAPATASATIPDIFFRSTFELMGHVAKSDGRVSEAEIQAARNCLNTAPAGTVRTAQGLN